MWAKETHKVLKFRQVRGSVIHLNYLNTICPLAQYSNELMIIGALQHSHVRLLHAALIQEAK